MSMNITYIHTLYTVEERSGLDVWVGGLLVPDSVNTLHQLFITRARVDICSADLHVSPHGVSECLGNMRVWWGVFSLMLNQHSTFSQQLQVSPLQPVAHKPGRGHEHDHDNHKTKTLYQHHLQITNAAPENGQHHPLGPSPFGPAAAHLLRPL